MASGPDAHHEFKQVEDRAVGEAIALQEASGVDVVTDGEMRRVLFTGSLTQDWQMPFSVTGRIAPPSVAGRRGVHVRSR